MEYGAHIRHRMGMPHPIFISRFINQHPTSKCVKIISKDFVLKISGAYKSDCKLFFGTPVVKERSRQWKSRI